MVYLTVNTAPVRITSDTRSQDSLELKGIKKISFKIKSGKENQKRIGRRVWGKNNPCGWIDIRNRTLHERGKQEVEDQLARTNT